MSISVCVHMSTFILTFFRAGHQSCPALEVTRVLIHALAFFALGAGSCSGLLPASAQSVFLCRMLKFRWRIDRS